MKIIIYADKDTEKEIRRLIKNSDGHCPCVLAAFRNEDTKCMCKHFRDSATGTICNCGLYQKIDD